MRNGTYEQPDGCFFTADGLAVSQLRAFETLQCLFLGPIAKRVPPHQSRLNSYPE